MSPTATEDAEHATPIVCKCGMQTGSEDSENTQNKSQVLF